MTRTRALAVALALCSACTSTPPPTVDVRAATLLQGDATTWVRASMGAPEYVPVPSAAWDSVRHRLVALSPEWNGSMITWEWDGSTWTRKDPVHAPPARIRGMIAFDEARGLLVLFGGSTWSYGANDERTDTWTWDGTDWTERHPLQAGPQSSWKTMTWDGARGQMVLVAAGSQGGVFEAHQTWLWDGQTWSKAAPATKPEGRLGQSLAYDRARSRVVMYGGDSLQNSFTPLVDTWEWDGIDWTKAPTTTHPTAFYGAAMEHDASRGRIVLHGGTTDPNASGSSRNELWEWDGMTWKAAGYGPEARESHSLVYDPDRGGLLFFGGERSAPGRGYRRNDLWLRSATGWKELNPGTPPYAGQPFAFDRQRGRIVGFGGTELANDNRTWEFDGASWRALPTVGPRGGSSWMLAYDTQRKVTLALGLAEDTGLQELWDWNGTTWTQHPTGNAPRDGAMAFDEQRGVLVHFGGWRACTSMPCGTLAETREWDGTIWTLRAPAISPSARSDTAMVYDARRGRTVLFGGNPASGGYLGDTWEWDGTDWVQQHPSEQPTPRYGHSLGWDAARQRVVMFGGYVEDSPTTRTWVNDVWEWDGLHWIERDPQGRPPVDFYGETLLYDSSRSRMVLLEGYSLRMWSLAIAKPGAIGGGCNADVECASGHCVDYVCCDTACGNDDRTDCLACSVAAGAVVNGTCAPQAAGVLCRASRGVCDIAESCDGVAAACPTDSFRPATDTCRAAAGPCDVAEQCTGSAAACPDDHFAATTLECAPAALCTAPAFCTGTAVTCPDRQRVPDGTPCPGGHCVAASAWVCVPDPDLGTPPDFAAPADLASPPDGTPPDLGADLSAPRDASAPSDLASADQSTIPAPTSNGCQCDLGGATPVPTAPLWLLCAFGLGLASRRMRCASAPMKKRTLRDVVAQLTGSSQL